MNRASFVLSRFAFFAITLFALPSIAFAADAGLGDPCAVTTNSAASSAERRAVLDDVTRYNQAISSLGLTVEQYTCQNTTNFTDSQKVTACKAGMCSGASNIQCCMPLDKADTIISRGNTNSGTQTSTTANEECGVDTGSMSAEARQAVNNLISNSQYAANSLRCQDASALSASQKTQFCVSNLCAGGDNIMCCTPGIPQPAPTETPTNEPTAQPRAGGVGLLALPACISDGNCGLDDLVTMGVNFANFLMGISGAIFLLVFVVSGFRYIFFAYDAGTASAAKSSIVKATLGMLIIALAGSFTRFVYTGLRQGAGGGQNVMCGQGEYSDYACRALTGVTIPDFSRDPNGYRAALERNNCKPSPSTEQQLCPGRTYCCKPETATQNTETTTP